MDVASAALSLFVVFSNAHRWVPERLFLEGDVFLKFMLTRFKECVFKKKKKNSTHPGWLCLPLRPAASSPSALKAVLPWRGKKTSGDEKRAARWGCWPVTFVQTQLLCVYTHGKHLDASFSAAVPEGEQSAQCLHVAQLDTAAELDWSLNARSGPRSVLLANGRMAVYFLGFVSCIRNSLTGFLPRFLSVLG